MEFEKNLNIGKQVNTFDLQYNTDKKNDINYLGVIQRINDSLGKKTLETVSQIHGLGITPCSESDAIAALQKITGSSKTSNTIETVIIVAQTKNEADSTLSTPILPAEHAFTQTKDKNPYATPASPIHTETKAHYDNQIYLPLKEQSQYGVKLGDTIKIRIGGATKELTISNAKVGSTREPGWKLSGNVLLDLHIPEGIELSSTFDKPNQELHFGPLVGIIDTAQKPSEINPRMKLAVERAGGTAVVINPFDSQNAELPDGFIIGYTQDNGHLHKTILPKPDICYSRNMDWYVLPEKNSRTPLSASPREILTEPYATTKGKAYLTYEDRKQLNVKVGDTITIHCGQTSLDISVANPKIRPETGVAESASDGRLRFSSDIISRLGFPDGTKLQARYQDNTISLGPIVGITEKTSSSVANKIRQAVKAFGGVVVVINPSQKMTKDIPLGFIKALVQNPTTKGQIESIVPYPNIIYDDDAVNAGRIEQIMTTITSAEVIQAFIHDHASIPMARITIPKNDPDQLKNIVQDIIHFRAHTSTNQHPKTTVEISSPEKVSSNIIYESKGITKHSQEGPVYEGSSKKSKETIIGTHGVILTPLLREGVRITNSDGTSELIPRPPMSEAVVSAKSSRQWENDFKNNLFHDDSMENVQNDAVRSKLEAGRRKRRQLLSLVGIAYLAENDTVFQIIHKGIPSITDADFVSAMAHVRLLLEGKYGSSVPNMKEADRKYRENTIKKITEVITKGGATEDYFGLRALIANNIPKTQAPEKDQDMFLLGQTLRVLYTNANAQKEYKISELANTLFP